MKKLTLLALLTAAMMFIGNSTLSANDMKCGAGKCGAAMKCGASMSKGMNAKGCKCQDCDNPNCAAKKDPSKPCDCKMDGTGKMKCGAKGMDRPAKKCGNATN